VNESDVKFSVNKKGEIRFALSAIKGVGDAAVAGLVEEQKLNGNFKSIFDFTKRVNLRTVNKKSIEGLALAGAFDGFGKYTRAQFFESDPKDNLNLLDKCLKWGNSEQSSKTMNQNSLFGGGIHVDSSEPILSHIEEWPTLEKLKREKEVVGIYISGHPLDNYRMEIEKFTNCSVKDIVDNKDKELRIAGIITATTTKVSKTGNHFVLFNFDDFEGGMEFALFGKDYIKYKNYVENVGALLYIKGKYQPRFNQPDNYEFKILEIELLPDIRTKLTRRVTMTIFSENITERVTDELCDIMTRYKGKTPVVMQLINNQELIKLNLNCRKGGIDLSNEFFAEMKSLEEVTINLN
jgi:DNA polymerase-3 subunit alpha